MRIYVAGRTCMLDKVERVQQLVCAAGHELTYDWTANVRAEGGSAREKHVPHERQVQYANADRKGVLEADCTIVVCGPELCGTLIECGLALSMCDMASVILYGIPEKESVFFELPEVRRITTEDELIDVLGTMVTI